MVIDYYCFAVQDLSLSELSKDFKDENTNYLHVKLKEDIEFATKINKCVLYNCSDDKFYFHNQEIQLKDKVIFPRGFLFQKEKMLDALLRDGAKSVISKEDENKIKYWPKYVQPNYRQIDITTMGEFKSNLSKFLDKYDYITEVKDGTILKYKKIFLKTLEKNFSSEIIVYYASKNLMTLQSESDLGKKTSESSQITIIHPLRNKYQFYDLSDDEKIFITKDMKLLRDDKGESFEYRAYAIDGKLANISRSYLDNEDINDSKKIYVPKLVIDTAKDVVEKANETDFPKLYCFDLFYIQEDDKTAVDIVEFNPLIASGREITNSIFSLEEEQQIDVNNFEM